MTPADSDRLWNRLGTASQRDLRDPAIREMLVKRPNIEVFISSGSLKVFDQAVQSVKEFFAWLGRTDLSPDRRPESRERRGGSEVPTEPDKWEQVIGIALATWVEREHRRELIALRRIFGEVPDTDLAALYQRLVSLKSGWEKLFDGDAQQQAINLLAEVLGDGDDPHETRSFSLLRDYFPPSEGWALLCTLQNCHPLSVLLRFTEKLELKMGWTEADALVFVLCGIPPTSYRRVRVRRVSDGGLPTRMNRLLISVDPTTPETELLSIYKAERSKWLMAEKPRKFDVMNAIKANYAYQARFQQGLTFDFDAARSAWDREIGRLDLTRRLRNWEQTNGKDGKLEVDDLASFPPKARQLTLTWNLMVNPEYRNASEGAIQ